MNILKFEFKGEFSSFFRKYFTLIEVQSDLLNSDFVIVMMEYFIEDINSIQYTICLMFRPDFAKVVCNSDRESLPQTSFSNSEHNEPIWFSTKSLQISDKTPNFIQSIL